MFLNSRSYLPITLWVLGKASQKKIFLSRIEKEDDHDLQLDLLSYLRKQQLPIASSCDGEGVCKKCVIQIKEDKLLSCQIKLKDLITVYHDTDTGTDTDNNSFETKDGAAKKERSLVITISYL